MTLSGVFVLVGGPVHLPGFVNELIYIKIENFYFLLNPLKFDIVSISLWGRRLLVLININILSVFNLKRM